MKTIISTQLKSVLISAGSAATLVLLASSLVEIFLQNYLTGIVSARLLGRSE